MFICRKCCLNPRDFDKQFLHSYGPCEECRTTALCGDFHPGEYPALKPKPGEVVVTDDFKVVRG